MARFVLLLGALTDGFKPGMHAPAGEFELLYQFVLDAQRGKLATCALRQACCSSTDLLAQVFACLAELSACQRMSNG